MMKKLVVAVLLASCGCVAMAQRVDPAFDPPRPQAALLVSTARAIDVEVERAYWTVTDDDIRMHLDKLHGTLVEMQILAASMRYTDAQCGQMLVRLQSADILGGLQRNGMLVARPTTANTINRVEDDLATEVNAIGAAPQPAADTASTMSAATARPYIPVPLPSIARPAATNVSMLRNGN